MKRILMIVLLCLPITMVASDGSGKDGCTAPTSRSGVSIANVAQVKTGPDGLTVEQRNIQDRLKLDSLPGSIKHLYVISAYSGQVLIYSTVRGKVTSSGKRLSPTMSSGSGFTVPINSTDSMVTDEVLQDDGTYGSSIEYIYWFDSKGSYHQHYIQGGQIVHVSDQPLAVKSIVMNMELAGAQ